MIPGTRFWPQERRGRRGIGRWLSGLRPFILAGIALAIWPTVDPALIEPPRFLSTDPEVVDAVFTRCGRGRGQACVVDGDTFKLGQRKIRVIGIDASEVNAQCPEEARLAVAATVRLQSLLNEGPFTMTGRIDDMQDRYGRDLRYIERQRPDGSMQSIAGEMRASGLARRYLGGIKTGWC